MAATMRRELLGSVGAEGTTAQFSALVKSAVAAGKENGSLPEFYEALTKKQREQFWIDLSPKLEFAAEVIESASGEASDEVTAAISLVSATCEMLHAAVSIKINSGVSADMLRAACAVHDLLFAFGPEHMKVRERIAQLCEAWWKKGLPGKDQLVPQTISYLLMKSMQPKARRSDVKRVYEFRESLLLIDLSDPSSELLKGGLLQCAVSPPFLEHDDGIKFLSYLFCLNLAWVEQLHGTIRSTLALCPTQYLDNYAAIYFKAWRAATGAYLDRIEQCCVQDLMDRAVHARRTGSGGGLARRLARVLNAFHGKKMERGVDEMLTRLYKPILWRALRANNPLVRANSATLLCSAFPLADPNANRADQDELNQKQFDAIAELLADDFPVVRLVGVEGVCRIVGVYWELIPKKTLTALLGKLVGNLAADATSVAVRVAVFKGLTFLLDNHLCRPLLKELLPKMAEMVHDPSERVRKAFYKLLLVVKKIRGVRFYEVVPLDHLFARLDVETDSNATLLVELLQTSYFPLDKSEASRVARCLHMAQAQPRAARVFFRHLSKFIPEDVAGKFIITVLDTVAESRSSGTVADKDDILEDWGDDTPAAANPEGAIEEADAGAILEACALLLGSLSDVLLSSENKAFCSMLAVSTRAVHSTVVDEYGPKSRATAAAEQIQMYVPASPAQVKLAIKDLGALDDSTPDSIVMAVVDRLCAWDKYSAVFTASQQWLNEAFDPSAKKVTSKTPTGSASRSKKKKAAAHPEPRRVNLALTCLSRALLTAAARGDTIPVGSVHVVSRTLGMATSVVANRIAGTDTTTGVSTDQLLRALELQFKMTVLSDITSPDEDTTVSATELLCIERAEWAQSVLLPFTPPHDGGKGLKRSARKRKTQDAAAAGDTSSTELVTVTPFLSALLVAVAEVLKVGPASHELNAAIGTFVIALLESDQARYHALGVGKVICELVLVGGDSTDVAVQLLPQWLLAASVDEGSLAAARPVLTSIAKNFQRRRRLLVLVPIIGDVCARVADDGNVAAIDFFAGYLTRTDSILQAFVAGLSPEPETLEAKLRLLTHISAAVAKVVDSGGQACSLGSIRVFATDAIATIGQHDAAAGAAVDVGEMSSPGVGTACAQKESASQKRTRRSALDAVTSTLSEKHLELDRLVADEDSVEAAELQHAIQDLETEAADLQPPMMSPAPEAEPSPLVAGAPMMAARSIAEQLVAMIPVEVVQ